MNLKPRPVNLETDTTLLRDFLTGRQHWQPLPPYWNNGLSRMAIYMTMYEGKNTGHLLWEDDDGVIQAYTYLSPDEKTPLYHTPEEREWRILLHPEHRTPDIIGRFIEDAETRLNTRTSTNPLTTVAYDSDQHLIDIISRYGYTKKRALTNYMTRSLLEPIAAPVVPDGFVIRPFAGLTELETRAIVPNSAFGGFDGPSEWSINDTGYLFNFCNAIGGIDFVVATTDGRIVCSAVVFHDAFTKLGEFDPVATHQQFQQQGLAKAAMLTSLHWLKGAGMKTAVIRTDVDNIPAQAAYRSIGYQKVDTLWLYEKQNDLH